MEKSLDESYWQQRWMDGSTGWDLGRPSAPLKYIIGELRDKEARILVPGGGNGYEAGYLFREGFLNTYLLDWAAQPLDSFSLAHPSFPKDHLLQQDFFKLDDTFDVILEQTFFCALNPSQRSQYVTHMFNLLRPHGVLTGVLFNHPLYADHPPFGGSLSEYEVLFNRLFHIDKLAPCTISEPDRQGMELIFRLIKPEK